jgi:hypothetical protein
VQRIILNFTPYANYSGIEFGLETDKLIFSPALMENEIVMYKLDVFNPGLIYLPLPNGIIGLREDLFIIKHNEFMNIACCIDKEKSKIRFAVSNPKKKQTYWVLTVFNGVAEDALSLAERINISPCVYL